MSLRPKPWVFALFTLAACAPSAQSSPPPQVASQGPATRPRLIVQITVDQLRADLLARFADRFVEGGLKRFLDEGVHYDAAAYAHAITETAVGHATLFTGALPRDHGIVGNEWFDGTDKRTAVEDARYHWLGRENRPGAGTAPTALRSTTIGDELILASAGAAKVFAVSLKDRAAILPGGHAGKAFWFDETTGDFVTSDYYYREPPAWLSAFQAARPQDDLPAEWNLLLPRDSYDRRDRDERPFERGFQGVTTFPHRIPVEDPKLRYRALKHTPFADELTLTFVSALCEAEQLGSDGVTDLLAVSFSVTDAVGHAYGPESLEAEDNLLRLDRTIKKLFEFLLTRVQPQELLVILSADHGVAETPEYLHELGLPSGRHPAGQVLVDALNTELAQLYGANSAFVKRFVNPTLWLDEAKIAERGLALEDVERAVADLALRKPGIQRAITKADLAHSSLPAGEIEQLVRASFDAERTGHVYLVPEPGWLLATDPADLAAMHGTPHVYDRAVPLAFWGTGLRPGRVLRPVDPRDIAPTLAALLGIKAPSGSSGRVLYEVTDAL